MNGARRAASTIAVALGASFSSLSMSLEQAVGGEVALPVHMAPAALCVFIAFVNSRGSANPNPERSPTEGAA